MIAYLVLTLLRARAIQARSIAIQQATADALQHATLTVRGARQTLALLERTGTHAETLH